MKWKSLCSFTVRSFHLGGTLASIRSASLLAAFLFFCGGRRSRLTFDFHIFFSSGMVWRRCRWMSSLLTPWQYSVSCLCLLCAAAECWATNSLTGATNSRFWLTSEGLPILTPILLKKILELESMYESSLLPLTERMWSTIHFPMPFSKENVMI